MDICRDIFLELCGTEGLESLTWGVTCGYMSLCLAVAAVIATIGGARTVKNWKRPTERYTLARMFEHQNMLSVCRNRVASGFTPASTQTDRELHLIADVFARAQQRRHTADYDGNLRWTRTEAMAVIESVERAFASWKAIRQDNIAQDFLVTLLIKERKRQ